ncbi:hypothetical protein GF362_00290 [Candidatus Dojkabacteria bacterium]|nr:hypothetical protein [Candidatus Dojkabacteria bacterium]
MKKYKYQKGYIALISVLVLGFVGLTITVSYMLLGLNSSEMSLEIVKGSKARALANACGEVALKNLKQDISYSGDETINLGDGFCEIYPIEINGTTRIIKVEGNIDGVVRRVKIELNEINPDVLESLWQEVDEF